MRRSLAPSTQSASRKDVGDSAKCDLVASRNGDKMDDGDGEIVIERLPMFGFLEIPSALNKQFRVPTGCIITKK
jgi:hypothetical protein